VAGADSLMRHAAAEARQAWPTVELDEDEFLAYLTARLPDEGRAHVLPTLHWSDLYLACACVKGIAAALQALDTGYLAEVRRRIGRQLESPDAVAEVIQIVRTRLLVAVDDQPPRIAAYKGTGPLLGFIHVAAARVVVDLRFRGPVVERRSEPADPRISTSGDPELLYIKWRYRSEFEQAFKATIADLPLHERNVLRLVYVENVEAGAVAELYRVSRRTVNRWLVTARERLLDETRRRMTERLALRPAEADEVMNLVASQIDLSLHRVLLDTPE
jgi:RNA polymerase sigma-70 factor (ECF subfamily)